MQHVSHTTYHVPSYLEHINLIRSLHYADNHQLRDELIHHLTLNVIGTKPCIESEYLFTSDGVLAAKITRTKLLISTCINLGVY